MIDVISIANSNSSEDELKKLYEEQTLLQGEICKCEHVIGAILDAFETKDALKWKREKKRAKLEVLNQCILNYNDARKQLIEIDKKIRMLEELE